MTAPSTMRTAEFVLPGHPDKLADAVADAIVQEARAREERAIVGVEVALNRNIAFIDGRVGCRGAQAIDLRKIVRSVYASAGYCAQFEPRPAKVAVKLDVHVGPLQQHEIASRGVADDQSIVTGYASSLPGTDGMPVEHALARRLALALHRLRLEAPELRLGPDGKVIVFVEEGADGRSHRLSDASISIHHAANWDFITAQREIERRLRREVESFALGVPGFDPRGEFALEVNPGGAFVEGGPLGDNGLSGKKLVADFYGPRVPIGGGAMSGKDFWRADRAGPLIARKLATLAVERFGCRECLVTLGIRPGQREFRIVRVEAQNRQPLELARLEGMVDLRLCSMHEWPDSAGDLVEVARWGHWCTAKPAQALTASAKSSGRRRSRSNQVAEVQVASRSTRQCASVRARRPKADSPQTAPR